MTCADPVLLVISGASAAATGTPTLAPVVGDYAADALQGVSRRIAAERAACRTVDIRRPLRTRHPGRSGSTPSSRRSASARSPPPATRRRPSTPASAAATAGGDPLRAPPGSLNRAVDARRDGRVHASAGSGPARSAGRHAHRVGVQSPPRPALRSPPASGKSQRPGAFVDSASPGRESTDRYCRRRADDQAVSSRPRRRREAATTPGSGRNAIEAMIASPPHLDAQRRRSFASSCRSPPRTSMLWFVSVRRARRSSASGSRARSARTTSPSHEPAGRMPPSCRPDGPARSTCCAAGAHRRARVSQSSAPGIRSDPQCSRYPVPAPLTIAPRAVARRLDGRPSVYGSACSNAWPVPRACCCRAISTVSLSQLPGLHSFEMRAASGTPAASILSHWPGSLRPRPTDSAWECPDRLCPVQPMGTIGISCAVAALPP